MTGKERRKLTAHRIALLIGARHFGSAWHLGVESAWHLDARDIQLAGDEAGEEEVAGLAEVSVLLLQEIAEIQALLRANMQNLATLFFIEF